MPGSGDGSWSRAFMAGSRLVAAPSAGSSAASLAEVHEAAAVALTAVRLRELAACRSRAVREVIARRPDCPPDVLAAFARDRSDTVRAAAAANEAAHRSVLERLARDSAAAVVKAVARNSSTPEELVESLMFHKREDVRRAAIRRGNTGAAPCPPPSQGGGYRR